jgi:hypothetical protein
MEIIPNEGVEALSGYIQITEDVSKPGDLKTNAVAFRE